MFFFFSQDNFKRGYVATFLVPNRKCHNEYNTWMSNLPTFHLISCFSIRSHIHSTSISRSPPYWQVVSNALQVQSWSLACGRNRYKYSQVNVLEGRLIDVKEMQGVKGENDHNSTLSIFPWWMGNIGKFRVASINGPMLER